MKNLKTTLITLFTLFTITSFAQFPVQGQYQSIAPSSTLVMPNFKDSVVDFSLPSPIQITRVSDYYVPWSWYPKHEYAKTQTWNANQTSYKMRSIWVYDAITHQKTHTMPSGSLYPAYWSNTDSNLMYGFREDGKIKTYSLNTSTLATIDTISGYDIVKLGPGEGNIDINDKYVALVGKRDTNLDVIIYDLQLNQIIHTEVFPGVWGSSPNVPKYIDWVSVSQSGDYVGIMWNHNVTSMSNPFKTHYGVEIYNTTNMNYLRRIAKYGNHGDFGYAADGKEVFVQFWGPNSSEYVNMFYLDTLKRVSIATHSDFDAAGHISCRNIRRPGWTYLTQTSASQSGQIIALKLDTSGIVEHFGHHFSSSTTYDKAPFAVSSPYGDKVMYKSDFGDSANVNLVYVFQNTLDPVSIGIEKNQLDNLSIYPNPTKGNLSFKMRSLINSIFIFNNLGQKIISISDINNFTYELNLENLNKGIYFIRLQTNDGKFYSKKLLKQ